MQDVDIEDSRLYKFWKPSLSSNHIENKKPIDTSLSWRKPPMTPGTVKYDGFCFHCNRFGHKPAHKNGCSLSPIEESEECKRAKSKVWEIKKSGRNSPSKRR